MSRCTKCNGRFIQKPLSTEEAIEAAKGFQKIPNCLFNKNLEFWQCMDCHQLYWEVLFTISKRLLNATETNDYSIFFFSLPVKPNEFPFYTSYMFWSYLFWLQKRGIFFFSSTLFYYYGILDFLTWMYCACYTFREPSTIMQYRSSLTFANWAINSNFVEDVHVSMVPLNTFPLKKNVVCGWM